MGESEGREDARFVAALQAAFEQDQAEAPQRNQAAWQQLRSAYGEEWFAAVSALPGHFQLVAKPAALARMDPDPGWWRSEREWIMNNAAMAQDAPPLSEKPLTDQPHTEAPNVFGQAVLVLRDGGLWPWLLTPRPQEGAQEV